MPNNIDPLDYEERLTKAGVPAEQAHVHAETIGQVKAELEARDERAKSSRLEDKIDDGFVNLNNKIDSGLADLTPRSTGPKPSWKRKSTRPGRNWRLRSKR